VSTLVLSGRPRAADSSPTDAGIAFLAMLSVGAAVLMPPAVAAGASAWAARSGVVAAVERIKPILDADPLRTLKRVFVPGRARHVNNTCLSPPSDVA